MKTITLSPMIAIIYLLIPGTVKCASFVCVLQSASIDLDSVLKRFRAVSWGVKIRRFIFYRVRWKYRNRFYRVRGWGRVHCWGFSGLRRVCRLKERANLRLVDCGVLV